MPTIRTDDNPIELDAGRTGADGFGRSGRHKVGFVGISPAHPNRVQDFREPQALAVGPNYEPQAIAVGIKSKWHPIVTLNR